jgi:endonuclease YncB( thermonuclease family)
MSSPGTLYRSPSAACRIAQAAGLRWRERRRGLVAAAAIVLSIVWFDAANADVIGEARVIDGDTIQVAGERIRLHGIDAPESRQACSLAGIGWQCGQDAKRMLSRAVDGKTVTCKGKKRDRYGRLIAVCYVGGDDLNAEMVRNGWALAYRKYAKDYVSQESAARAAGAGMWQGQFTEPWEWRREQRERQHEGLQ